MTDAQPPVQPDDLQTVLAGDTLPDEATLRRAEEKPPLYRAFRTALYVTYLLVVAWFVIAIIVGAYNAVWGPQGQALAAKEKSTGSKPSHSGE